MLKYLVVKIMKCLVNGLWLVKYMYLIFFYDGRWILSINMRIVFIYGKGYIVDL